MVIKELEKHNKLSQVDAYGIINCLNYVNGYKISIISIQHNELMNE